MPEEVADREIPIFSKGVGMPEGFDAARSFKKKVTTRALRIEGPFAVQTSEGLLKCDDGWLAVDARGYPYPIAASEFELIYEPAEADNDEVPDSVPPEWEGGA